MPMARAAHQPRFASKIAKAPLAIRMPPTIHGTAPFMSCSSTTPVTTPMPSSAKPMR